MKQCWLLNMVALVMGGITLGHRTMTCHNTIDHESINLTLM